MVSTQIPTMLSQKVRDHLRTVGASWTGQGDAVECGAWLGGGTAALADGLSAAGYNRTLHVYDRWEANKEEVSKAAAAGLAIYDKQDIEPIFRDFVHPHCQFDVETYRGRIDQAVWCGGPIEIWLLDAAKREGPFYGALKAFGPSWIPGVTTVGLLDFGFYRSFGDDPKAELYLEQKAFIDRFRDRFEVVKDFQPGDSPVFFRYVKAIDWGAEL